MSRPLRLQFENALYHVTSRGDRREDIYLDDADRVIWLEVFAQVCERFGWRCLAWCLMSNHYHVVVQTPRANLAEGMRQLNGVYTQRHNRRHGRVGHVFQGRYKAIFVDTDRYLLELARYVVLNPVRAGMVPMAGDWAWSSYSATRGTEPCPDWLETEPILTALDADRSVAQARYEDFVRAGVGLPSIWRELTGQSVLGDAAFALRLEKALKAEKPSSREVPRAQWRRKQPLVAQPFASLAERDIHVRAAFASGDYTLKEFGEAYALHYSSVSRIVGRRAAKQGPQRPEAGTETDA